jgi:hypothetical protein
VSTQVNRPQKTKEKKHDSAVTDDKRQKRRQKTKDKRQKTKDKRQKTKYKKKDKRHNTKRRQ